MIDQTSLIFNNIALLMFSVKLIKKCVITIIIANILLHVALLLGIPFRKVPIVCFQSHQTIRLSLSEYDRGFIWEDIAKILFFN